MLLHATCIAIADRAVLLTGASGVGKSDLALRLIDCGAQLVADDQTLLRVAADRLLASPPASIAGLLEVRHVGVFKMPFITAVPVALCVDLATLTEKLERLPEPDSVLLLDHCVQRLRLPAYAASTPAKIRAALTYSET
jgi:serine kinase of HPr protein (carbohydrate metabolism regulator)